MLNIGILSSCAITDTPESSASFSANDSMKIAATVHSIVEKLNSPCDTIKRVQIKFLQDNPVSSIPELQEKLFQEFDILIKNPALINSDTLSLCMRIILTELETLSLDENSAYYNLPKDEALRRFKNKLYFFLGNPTQRKTLQIINGVIYELINEINEDITPAQYTTGINTIPN